MAKEKPIMPLFPLRHQFEDALGNYINQSTNLANAVAMALRSGKITGPAAEILQERLDAFNAARSSD